MRSNKIILEVWKGTVYGEAEIDEFHSMPQFSETNQTKNVYFVNSNRSYWSWRIFFEFLDENNTKKYDYFNMLKEDFQEPNPNPGTRYFNDASNDEQNNHTCAFTVIDNNVFDEKKYSFVWRQNFGDWFGVYNGSLDIINIEDISDEWMDILLDGLNMFDKSDGLFSKEYLLGLGHRWGIDAEAGHLIETGYKTIMPNGDGTYQVGPEEILDADKEKVKFTKSVDKHKKNSWKLFIPLPSDLSEDKLANVAIPDISKYIGTEYMAEHLGIAVREGNNGSINAHININAKMMGGQFLVNEEEARIIIENWIKDTDLNTFKNDKDLGMEFLTKVIAKIVD